MTELELDLGLPEEPEDNPALPIAIKYTERMMLDLLHRRYSQTNPGNGPRYAVAEHVKNQAGFDARRCADFIAVDCWPSRGIAMHGHEVKVSRRDWLTELKDPSKADAFKRYMDHWWLVVPDLNIVRPGELPDGWGLLVTSNRQSTGKWPKNHAPVVEQCLRVKVPAPRLTPEPLPKEILATLMRSCAKTSKRRAHELFCTPPCAHRGELR